MLVPTNITAAIALAFLCVVRRDKNLRGCMVAGTGSIRSRFDRFDEIRSQLRFRFVVTKMTQRCAVVYTRRKFRDDSVLKVRTQR